MHNALLSGDPHDQLAIAYHLIIDNKRIADEAAKAEIKDFYVASSPPPTSMSPSPGDFGSSPMKPHPERIAPLRDRVIASNQATSGERGRGWGYSCVPVRYLGCVGFSEASQMAFGHPLAEQAERYHDGGVQGDEGFEFRVEGDKSISC